MRRGFGSIFLKGAVAVNVVQVVDAVRDVISRYDCSITEKDLYEALMAQAEGWKMRLEEVEADEKDSEGEDA